MSDPTVPEPKPPFADLPLSAREERVILAVAYMIAVKRSSLLFGIVYGALVFGEARLRQHLFAGSLMVAGVALVVL